MRRPPARSIVLSLIPLAALSAAASPLSAQSAGVGSMEPPPLLERAREIALARSAAPASVSGDATVLVLERGEGYVVAEEGTNGVTCLVDRTWPESVEPTCYDREGSETVLRLRLRMAELREAGATMAEVLRDRAEGLRSGRLRAPSKLVLTWMMSAGQVLYDDDGKRIGEWRPHLMIYYPGMTEAELGLAGGRYAHGPFLSDGGEPTAKLIVPMPEFIPVGGGGPAGEGGV